MLRALVLVGVYVALRVSDARWPIVVLVLFGAWVVLAAIELTQHVEPRCDGTPLRTKSLGALGDAFSISAIAIFVLADVDSLWWVVALILLIGGTASWWALGRRLR